MTYQQLTFQMAAFLLISMLMFIYCRLTELSVTKRPVLS